MMRKSAPATRNAGRADGTIAARNIVVRRIGTGVALSVDFGYSFGNRVKFLHLTPEPKPFSVGIVATKRPTQPSRGKNSASAREKRRHQA